MMSKVNRKQKYIDNILQLKVERLIWIRLQVLGLCGVKPETPPPLPLKAEGAKALAGRQTYEASAGCGPSQAAITIACVGDLVEK